MKKDPHLVRRLMRLAFPPNDSNARVIPPKHWELQNVFSEEFFSRVWIIQEVASAKDVILIDGGQEISLKQSSSHGLSYTIISANMDSYSTMMLRVGYTAR
jgi:hypothetical protein